MDAAEALGIAWARALMIRTLADRLGRAATMSAGPVAARLPLLEGNASEPHRHPASCRPWRPVMLGRAMVTCNENTRDGYCGCRAGPDPKMPRSLARPR